MRHPSHHHPHCSASCLSTGSSLPNTSNIGAALQAESLAVATNFAELGAAVTMLRRGEPSNIYVMYDHGVLSILAGQPRLAKQHFLGNSRVATTMTIHDVRAAQSAPISNPVHEKGPRYTTVEFECTASMFTALREGTVNVSKEGAQLGQLQENVFVKVLSDLKAGRVGENGL